VIRARIERRFAVFQLCRARWFIGSHVASSGNTDGENLTLMSMVAQGKTDQCLPLS